MIVRTFIRALVVVGRVLRVIVNRTFIVVKRALVLAFLAVFFAPLSSKNHHRSLRCSLTGTR